jgi:HTH-like domain
VHTENFGVYGVEKIWRQLNREGVRVGRDRVARLMRELNLEGAVRGKRKRTTVAGELDETCPVTCTASDGCGEDFDTFGDGSGRSLGGQAQNLGPGWRG